MRNLQKNLHIIWQLLFLDNPPFLDKVSPFSSKNFQTTPFPSIWKKSTHPPLCREVSNYDPKMSIQEFNKILMPTLEKISMENKDTYLMGDFKINLISYNSHNPTSQFLDGICSNTFFSYINIPTCHTSRSKTFIDNIFHNNINENAISENLTTDISDHLAQFLITNY